jgi:hypothetical protein
LVCVVLFVGVSAGRIRPLEAFELSGPVVNATAIEGNPDEYYKTLLQLKEQANALFELRDYDSARNRYLYVLKAVENFNNIGVGSTVIVLPPNQLSRSPGYPSSATASSRPLDAEANLHFPCGIIVDCVDAKDDKIYEIEFEDYEGRGSGTASSAQLVILDGCCSRWARSLEQEVLEDHTIKIWDIQRAVYLNLCRCAIKWSVMPLSNHC